SRPKSPLILRPHPYVEAYLTRGFPSRRTKWFMKFNKWIKVLPDSEFHLSEYRFFDGNEDEIRL
ncbi:MAG: ribonuclease E/G, partial [Bacteroidota bacterium]